MRVAAVAAVIAAFCSILWWMGAEAEPQPSSEPQSASSASAEEQPPQEDHQWPPRFPTLLEALYDVQPASGHRILASACAGGRQRRRQVSSWNTYLVATRADDGRVARIANSPRMPDNLTQYIGDIVEEQALHVTTVLQSHALRARSAVPIQQEARAGHVMTEGKPV